MATTYKHSFQVGDKVYIEMMMTHGTRPYPRFDGDCDQVGAPTGRWAEATVDHVYNDEEVHVDIPAYGFGWVCSGRALAELRTGSMSIRPTAPKPMSNDCSEASCPIHKIMRLGAAGHDPACREYKRSA